MRQFKPWVVLIFIAVAALLWQRHVGSLPPTVAPAPATQQVQPVDSRAAHADLPPEAQAMLRRIARGGPFEHRQDGTVFGNYEGLLPQQPRGYYHEYTVETPGATSRGARRIVTGGTPPVVWYYTGDHYRSFRRIEVNP
jgi:ribonuclease T1